MLTTPESIQLRCEVVMNRVCELLQVLLVGFEEGGVIHLGEC